MDELSELCRMCGLTFGSHCADSRGSMCPEHEGRMDFPADGRGTRFVGTGRYGEVEHGTPRAYGVVDA